MAPVVPEAPRPPQQVAIFKRQTGEQIDGARRGGAAVLKEKFIGIFLQGQIALQRMKQRVRDKLSGKDPNALKKPLQGEITDPQSEVHTVSLTEIHVKKTLAAYKDDSSLIPETATPLGGEILSGVIAAIDDPDSLSDAVSPYIYRLMHKAMNEDIKNPLGLLDIEELQHLKHLNPELGGKIIGILENTAPKANVSANEVKEWKTKLKAGETPTAELRQDRPDAHPGSVERDPFSYQARDFQSIKTRLRDPADRELLDALVNHETLDVYIGRVIEKMAPNWAELPEPERDKISKAISYNFKNDIELLIGKLFREVDESAPEEFWEEAAKAGSPFENTETQSQAFLKQLTNLRFEDYSNEPNIKKLKWFTKAGLEDDVRIPTEAQFPKGDARDKTTEMQRFVTPFHNDEEVKFREYFLTLYNGGKDEIGIRKFLHNATALFYQPPPEGGYYRQLEKYAEHFLPGSAIDILSTLPDSHVAYSASQLEDKLLEADFAMFNWVHQPTLSTLDAETKKTERNERTLEYLGRMYPKLLEGKEGSKETGWRIRRALAMGVGDNHSISLKALEHGARADAPRNIQAGYDRDISSYDKKDHIPYMAFNPFNHYNLRYGMDRTMIADLIFLPVEGDIRRSLTGFWDHNSVIKNMQEMKNSWVRGRDTDKHTMLIDYTNIGRAGSIYTRTGDIGSHSSWRKYHSYEGYLVGKGKDHDILKTWKNVENIGTEVLIDYIDRIGDLNNQFYTNTPDGEAMRRQLVDHVYRRYFKARGQDPATVSQAEVDNKFSELERTKDDKDELKKGYKKFYYQTVVRAMRQRIPTKFLRYERNREVVGRKRAWEEIKDIVVKDTAGLQDDKAYRQAVRDLIAAEVKERAEVTVKMKEEVESKRELNGHLSLEAARRLHENDIGYELTEDKLRTYLTEMNITGERADNAVRVLNGIYEFTENPKTETDGTPYLDKFASKYENNMFPFAMGVEELERSLLAKRASGERTPARAFMDIANVEEKVSNTFADYWLKLKDVASNGKQDFSELVHAIETAKDQLEIDIGPDYAEKFSHHMAAVTISYFKKDTIGRNLITRTLLTGSNRKYSIAAEFAGTYRGIWEWNVNDVADFVNTLEARSILPKDPYEAGHPPHYEEKNIRILNPFTKKPIATLPFKAKFRKPDREWYGAKLREDFGATNWHIVLEYINKGVPIVLGFVLFQYIKEAIEEAQGKNQ